MAAIPAPTHACSQTPDRRTLRRLLRRLAARLYADIRAETYGEDIGQTSWTDAAELAMFSSWLQLDRGGDPVLLDVACGSGGPALRIARLTGCRVRGIDAHAAAVQAARDQAGQAGLGDRASFEQVDASRPLPFEDASFDAITCIDAILHLPGRPQVLAEWARVLKPGGRLLFTDPVIVSGAVTNEELAIRSSIGFFLFVPPGHDEALIAASGLELVTKKTAPRTWRSGPAAGAPRASSARPSCAASRVTRPSRASSASSRSRPGSPPSGGCRAGRSARSGRATRPLPRRGETRPRRTPARPGRRPKEKARP